MANTEQLRSLMYRHLASDKDRIETTTLEVTAMASTDIYLRRLP